MYEFYDSKWIWNFRMLKEVVMRFVSVLSPHVEKTTPGIVERYLSSSVFVVRCSN